jgi:hypothetical protein
VTGGPTLEVEEANQCMRKGKGGEVEDEEESYLIKDLKRYHCYEKGREGGSLLGWYRGDQWKQHLGCACQAVLAADRVEQARFPHV